MLLKRCVSKLLLQKIFFLLILDEVLNLHLWSLNTKTRKTGFLEITLLFILSNRLKNIIIHSLWRFFFGRKIRKMIC